MSTRERLLQAGMDLFHRHGIHPVGLDRILQQAGVTKTTFYNYFETKEDFICAVIDRFGEEVHAHVYRRFDVPHGMSFKQHLLLIFDSWDELCSSENFKGCMLVGAGVSTPDPHDPTRRAAIRNKKALIKIYEDIATNAGIKDPVTFSRRFGVLIDGAILARQLYGEGDFKETRRMVELLIDEAQAERGVKKK